MSLRWSLAATILAVGACNTTTKDFFAPSVALSVTLPAELPPLAATCLDIVVAPTEGQPAATSLGFGDRNALIKVQTLDVNGDGRLETRIRYTQGSLPFFSDTTTFRLTAGTAFVGNAAFTLELTVRLPDGAIAEDDRCLGGTALASARVERDAMGQPLRFPSTGELRVPVPLTCVRTGGCALPAPDGGFVAPDAGSAPVDGGSAPDAGAVDGGDLDAGLSDGGPKDGGA